MSSDRIDLFSPLNWLKRGWGDFVRNPVPGLVHGLALAAFGWFLIWIAFDRFWLLAGAFSGFMIVAPILTSGLYLISRNSAVGGPVGLREVFRLWRSFDGRLVVFGMLLNLAGTGWVMTSAAMVTAMAPGQIHNPADFLRLVVLNPNIGLFEAWLLLGGLLAAPVFASSVVAIPMLLDTQVGVRQAVMASWRAVGTHPQPLALWATLIMVLVGVGMLTGLLGLVVVVPVLAHASWHAYVDLTAGAYAILNVWRRVQQPQRFNPHTMENTIFGYNEAQIAGFGLTVGVTAFILYMLFIVLNLARESKAGKFGTFILFLVLSFGMLGFVSKNIIQWVLGM